MVKDYHFIWKGTEKTVLVNDETQLAVFVCKGEKWIDSLWHETAWQILSPCAFKLYDKFERQANGYLWVLDLDSFGMSDEVLLDAIAELERKGFLQQATKTDQETGEVTEFPNVYYFYEKVQL